MTSNNNITTTKTTSFEDGHIPAAAEANVVDGMTNLIPNVL